MTLSPPAYETDSSIIVLGSLVRPLVDRDLASAEPVAGRFDMRISLRVFFLIIKKNY